MNNKSCSDGELFCRKLKKEKLEKDLQSISKFMAGKSFWSDDYGRVLEIPKCDRGASALFNGKLAAIKIDIANCNDVFEPLPYAKVYDYLNWIKNHTGIWFSQQIRCC